MRFDHDEMGLTVLIDHLGAGGGAATGRTFKDFAAPQQQFVGGYDAGFHGRNNSHQPIGRQSVEQGASQMQPRMPATKGRVAQQGHCHLLYGNANHGKTRQ
jgi:hypothetical protein